MVSPVRVFHPFGLVYTIGRTPSRRWGEVDELAGAAVFLASDAARFVNGHELENWPQGPQLHDVLDQLGDDGWELINVVKSEALYGTMDRIQAFFKRLQ